MVGCGFSILAVAVRVYNKPLRNGYQCRSTLPASHRLVNRQAGLLSRLLGDLQTCLPRQGRPTLDIEKPDLPVMLKSLCDTGNNVSLLRSGLLQEPSSIFLLQRSKMLVEKDHSSHRQIAP